jgi:1-acyl-sn-glycerol-3-phosphate acyltransferase
MYDIIAMIWYLRRFHKFVSKSNRGIPSISFNLRHGGSVLTEKTLNKRFLLRDLEYIENITVQQFFRKELEVEQGSQKYFANRFKILCKNTPRLMSFR